MLKRYTYIVYVMMRVRSESKEGMIKLIVNNLLRIQNERKNKIYQQVINNAILH